MKNNNELLVVMLEDGIKNCDINSVNESINLGVKPTEAHLMLAIEKMNDSITKVIVNTPGFEISEEFIFSVIKSLIEKVTEAWAKTNSVEKTVRIEAKELMCQIKKSALDKIILDAFFQQGKRLSEKFVVDIIKENYLDTLEYIVKKTELELTDEHLNLAIESNNVDMCKFIKNTGGVFSAETLTKAQKIVSEDERKKNLEKRSRDSSGSFNWPAYKKYPTKAEPSKRQTTRPSLWLTGPKKWEEKPIDSPSPKSGSRLN